MTVAPKASFGLRSESMTQAPETLASTKPHTTPKYAFIDALRGYAVLLVITSHTGGMFPELPYPVKN